MKCVECGSFATNLNAQGIPVCSRHTKSKVKAPTCPECKSLMTIRESKYGRFWGCTAYPMCDGIVKI